MEEGVKEELPEKPKCASTADKVGWIKKNSGGILGLWKERYILLCKSQLLMYEDEDQQKCVETVELENYEKCQDLRALLNRKHRFILVRSPGYKVQDIKFQAYRKEEKESWMKALNVGINRGKNRVFDELNYATEPAGNRRPISLPCKSKQDEEGKVASKLPPSPVSQAEEFGAVMSSRVMPAAIAVSTKPMPGVAVRAQSWRTAKSGHIVFLWLRELM